MKKKYIQIIQTDSRGTESHIEEITDTVGLEIKNLDTLEVGAEIVYKILELDETEFKQIQSERSKMILIEHVKRSKIFNYTT
jgi:hypothetical protein